MKQDRIERIRRNTKEAKVLIDTVLPLIDQMMSEALKGDCRKALSDYALSKSVLEKASDSAADTLTELEQED